MTNECDILIVGAGPAGLTAAWEAAAAGTRRVLLIDAGPDLPARRCPALRARVCPSCRHCDLLQGVGGASGIVGGKLCYFPAGERLARHVGLTSTEANDVISSLMSRLHILLPRPMRADWTRGAPRYRDPHSSLALKTYEAFPILADDLGLLFATLRDAAVHCGVGLHAGTSLQSLRRGAGNTAFDATLKTKAGSYRLAVTESVVLATGRSTTPWLTKLFDEIGALRETGSVDVGVRMECDASATADFLCDFEDPKLLLRPGTPREVRTLCWCRGGSMTVTSMAGHQLIDGHFGASYSDRSSVSIVARRPVPSGIQPLEHATSLLACQPGRRPTRMALAEFLGGNPPRTSGLPVLSPCQTDPMRLDTFPPDLVADLQEFLFNLTAASGRRLLNDPTAVVYGPVIDQQWPTPCLDARLQTSVPGLYVAGDIQGRARGIVQALFSGWIVGQALVHSEVPSATTSRVGAHR